MEKCTRCMHKFVFKEDRSLHGGWGGLKNVQALRETLELSCLAVVGKRSCILSFLAVFKAYPKK